MLIKNLFERDISRSINGVVKADQLDEYPFTPKKPILFLIIMLCAEPN